MALDPRTKIPWALLPSRYWKNNYQTYVAVPEVRDWANGLMLLLYKQKFYHLGSIIVSLWWLPLYALACFVIWLCDRFLSKLGATQMMDRATEIKRRKIPEKFRSRPMSVEEVQSRIAERFPNYQRPPKDGYGADQ